MILTIRIIILLLLQNKTLCSFHSQFNFYSGYSAVRAQIIQDRGNHLVPEVCDRNLEITKAMKFGENLTQVT